MSNLPLQSAHIHLKPNVQLNFLQAKLQEIVFIIYIVRKEGRKEGRKIQIKFKYKIYRTYYIMVVGGWGGGKGTDYIFFKF